MDEPVQDGVRQGRGRKHIVPFIMEKLPRNHGGGPAIPELGQFHHPLRILRRKSPQAPVVWDQKWNGGQLLSLFHVAAVHFSRREQEKQVRNQHILPGCIGGRCYSPARRRGMFCPRRRVLRKSHFAYFAYNCRRRAGGSPLWQFHASQRIPHPRPRRAPLIPSARRSAGFAAHALPSIRRPPACRAVGHNNRFLMVVLQLSGTKILRAPPNYIKAFTWAEIQEWLSRVRISACDVNSVCACEII